MAAQSGKNGVRKGSGKGAGAKKVYFGPKPPKADRKALEALLAEQPLFVLDFLAGFETGERVSIFHDESEDTWVCFYNMGSATKGSPERVITGRSQSSLKAVAIVAYWLKTMQLDDMFPETDDDDDEPF